MAKLTIVVGVGGSGKTSLCREISKETGARMFEDATLTNIGDGRDDRRAGFGCLGELVARLLGRDEDCVMDESHLATHPFRDLFRRFCTEHLVGVQQEWTFFEHDALVLQQQGISCIGHGAG